ncbi:MAG TPA: zinc ribbon domain-containing protein [Anaerovoracaceae bacterium]|nr:zinc ribbon domain-containing protein [Anaerovoracaceae bacterium]
MPVYEHICDECEHEWDDIYSWRDPIPTVCPECGTEGKVRRLISLPSNGVVQLQGHELKAKLRADAVKFKSDVRKDENLLANIVGENKYHNNELKRAEAQKERPKIKKSRKKSA